MKKRLIVENKRKLKRFKSFNNWGLFVTGILDKVSAVFNLTSQVQVQPQKGVFIPFPFHVITKIFTIGYLTVSMNLLNLWLPVTDIRDQVKAQFSFTSLV